MIFYLRVVILVTYQVNLKDFVELIKLGHQLGDTTAKFTPCSQAASDELINKAVDAIKYGSRNEVALWRQTLKANSLHPVPVSDIFVVYN
jgi:hypothetical protein